MSTEANGPSLHVRWHELAAHNGEVYPLAWRESRAIVLAEEYEAIRALCGGRPIIIASAYRSPKWNDLIRRQAKGQGLPGPSGSQYSYHCKGQALDLLPPRGLTLEEFYAHCECRARMPASAIRGLGRYPTFVHVDCRPQATLTRWTGRRLVAESSRAVCAGVAE